MKHIIDGKEINIDWEVVETVDNLGNGCREVSLKGEGDDGNTYSGCGSTFYGEIDEVDEDYIELAD